MIEDQHRWNQEPHEHCRCGSRLVVQPYRGTELVCMGCGYFDPDCGCDPRACEYCGREPGT